MIVQIIDKDTGKIISEWEADERDFKLSGPVTFSATDSTNQKLVFKILDQKLDTEEKI
jgi:hypothetical protein